MKKESEQGEEEEKSGKRVNLIDSLQVFLVSGEEWRKKRVGNVSIRLDSLQVFLGEGS